MSREPQLPTKTIRSKHHLSTRRQGTPCGTPPSPYGTGSRSGFTSGVLIAVVCFAGCRDTTSEPPVPVSAASALFRDVAAEKGIDWTHDAGDAETCPMPQIMGGGCAIFDANQDGDLDVLFVPGAGRTGDSSASAAAEQRLVPLYLQTPAGTFRDHSSAAGMVIPDHGMGATTGDYNNDGRMDLLITTASGPVLFRNEGEAVFTDVTADSGIDTARWSASAGFADYDRDGWLDLFVVNYVDYIPGSVCQDGTGRRDYCGPQAFSGTTDRLYRNTGDGSFEDVTVASGIVGGAGRGLGVIGTDLTGDGRVDFYVANDMEPNRLWVQQPDQTFRDEAELRGCATDVHGRPQASMGSVWCDLDDDGQDDLFLTHLRGETNTLYSNFGNGLFLDRSGPSGLGQGSHDYTGFGVAAVDVELDGNRDLLIANGRVMRAPLLTPTRAESHWAEYAERNQLYRGSASGEFVPYAVSGEAFTSDVQISRGLATGDIDGDGDLDVLVANINGPGRLYENIAPRSGHWLTVRVFDEATRRDAAGARVRVVVESREWQAELLPNCGYQSSHAPQLHFGTGTAERYDRIEVIWPDGRPEAEVFDGGHTDRSVTLVRGRGRRASEPKATPADGVTE